MTTTNRELDTADPILNDIVRKIVEVYHPQRIYLFGSRACGSNRSDSDYDLMIVVDDGTPVEFRSAGKAYQALWGITVPVDILVWTNEAFNKRLHIANSLPAEIIRQGKLLHAA